MEEYSVRTAEHEPLLEDGSIAHGIEDDGSLPPIKTFGTPEEAVKAALVLKDQEVHYLKEMVGDTETYVYSEKENSKHFDEPLFKTGSAEHMQDMWKENIDNNVPTVLTEKGNDKRDTPSVDKDVLSDAIRSSEEKWGSVNKEKNDKKDIPSVDKDVLSDAIKASEENREPAKEEKKDIEKEVSRDHLTR